MVDDGTMCGRIPEEQLAMSGAQLDATADQPQGVTSPSTIQYAVDNTTTSLSLSMSSPSANGQYTPPTPVTTHAPVPVHGQFHGG